MTVSIPPPHVGLRLHGNLVFPLSIGQSIGLKWDFDMIIKMRQAGAVVLKECCLEDSSAYLQPGTNWGKYYAMNTQAHCE